MNKILFIESWNCTPHLETSFELAKKHLDLGDEVFFHFIGQDLPYKECLPYQREDVILNKFLPENIGASILKHPRFKYFSKHKFFKTKINRNLLFKDIYELKKFRYKNCESGLAVASSLISLLRDSSPDLKKNSFLISTMLQSSSIVYDLTIDLLDKYKPDLVYIFNGRLCNYRPVLNACQETKTPFLIHERGANAFHYSIRPFMPHHLRKVEEEMNTIWLNAIDRKHSIELAKLFFEDRRKGVEQSWLSFSKNQESGNIPNLPKNKKIVTFFTSSEDEYAAVGDIVRWPNWPNQKSALMTVIRHCRNHESFQLVLRIHPHTKMKSDSEQAYWRNFKSFPDLIFVDANDKTDTYALIEKSDVVITVGSTVGIESVFWGTPSVCMGPSLYESLGAVYLPKNDNELCDLLLRDDLKVYPDRALPYGYHKMVFGEKYMYYSPENLFKGKFMGFYLNKCALFYSTNRFKKFFSLNYYRNFFSHV
ncbi:MAG: hypothetical protein NWQ39_02550 [Saprospiraceae bacterium]|nr:hypothetical protein [Saprospiraceae bacterium]